MTTFNDADLAAWAKSWGLDLLTVQLRPYILSRNGSFMNCYATHEEAIRAANGMSEEQPHYRWQALVPNRMRGDILEK